VGSYDTVPTRSFIFQEVPMTLSKIGQAEERRTLAFEKRAGKDIRQAENFVLQVARDKHCNTLNDLRHDVREASRLHPIDELNLDLLPVAIFRLLNAGRLGLTSDRQLHIPASPTLHSDD